MAGGGMVGHVGRGGNGNTSTPFDVAILTLEISHRL
jgi:hypothetical protein